MLTQNIGTCLYVAAVIVLCFTLGSSPLCLNESSSIPMGLYWRQKQATNVAGLCLPKETVQRGVALGVELLKGECANGYQPILKTIVRATPEMPITLDENGFALGAARLRNTKPKLFAKIGVPLEHAEFRTYTGGLFAISTYSKDSWDSRYYGRIPDDSILFYVKPVLTF